MTFDNSRNSVKHHGGKVGTNADGKQGLYAAVPVELARDKRLTHAARSVAIYIWSHNENWQQSISSVASALGTDRKTVSAALACLQGAGWMIREKLGAKRERWHLQMSNTSFTQSEIEEILPNVTSTEVEEKLPNPSGGMGKNSPMVWGETPQPIEEKLLMKEVHPGMHPVHSRSTRTDQDETGLGSRSLAVEGSEAAEGAADGRGRGGPFPEAADDAAEYRPDGLRSATAGSRFDDPFASEPAWRAEAAAREERAARYLQPASTGGPPASPWD